MVLASEEVRPNLNWSFMNCVRPLAGVIGALALSATVGCILKAKPEQLAPADVESTLFLIGDAGEPDPRERGVALDSMTAQAAVAPQRSVVVFLGDNVYPNGIPEEGQAEYADARRRLQAQVDAVPRGARGIFVPGNHDWGGMGPFGLYAIRLQERMIASMAAGRDIRLLPSNGCPGPVAENIGRLKLILLDTQWWLHGYILRDADSKCATTTAAVTAMLREEVRQKLPGGVTVVAAHHPLMTGGAHGGYCGITGPFRRLGGDPQDILSGLNRAMRDSIEKAFTAQPPLVYVAGHDHSLQVLKGGPSVRYLLVSGAGSPSKLECSVRLRESYFIAPHRSGFMRLDIMRNKGVLLTVFQYGGATGGLSYSKWLELR
jgi:hypothetical protein